MRRVRNAGWGVLVMGLLAGIVACAPNDSVSPAAATRTTRPSASLASAPSPSPVAAVTASASPTPATTPSPPVVLAAGDIGACDLATDERTAEIVASVDGTVLTLGDHAYPDGTAAQFADCYGPSWGRVLDRTRPVLGNHDYHTGLGQPYFTYFDAAAGTPGEGWYSFDLGEWHVVALNSNCELVGCDAESPQGQWLARDLADNAGRCALAYFHHPRWSSGPEGDQAKVAELWRLLHEGGVDVVLSAHAHQFERLAPMDADGIADPERGTRQFVVGTGGRSLYGFGAINPRSEARWNESFGVLMLTLRPDGYDWEFLPVDAGGFTDAGSAACS